MDLQQFAIATFVIIGLVNGVKYATDKEWKSFVFFLVAVFSGILFGYLGWFGLANIEIGLAVGIGSSGVYKSATKLGGS